MTHPCNCTVCELGRRELLDLRRKTGVSIGVGDGGGSMFVHGDHASIKRVQDIILERERLAVRNSYLEDRNRYLEQWAKELPVSKLTLGQLERLALLVEEMGEATQAVGKVIRHGYGSKHPETFVENTTMLERELGDVRHSMDRMFQEGDISKQRVGVYAHHKSKRVGRYLHHQPKKTEEN